MNLKIVTRDYPFTDDFAKRGDFLLLVEYKDNSNADRGYLNLRTARMTYWDRNSVQLYTKPLSTNES